MSCIIIWVNRFNINWSLVFTAHPRQRFPYPETQPQRERPGRTPPPRPRPRPRPRLRHFTPPRVSDPASLSSIIGPRMLVQTVLQQFPHPDPSRRVSWSDIKELAMESKLLWRLMRVLISLRCHGLLFLMIAAGVPPGFSH